MKIVRWILCIPVSLIVLGLAQIGTSNVGEQLHWFWCLVVLAFVSVFISMATFGSIRIAPNPKIGATIVLTIFLLTEAIALFTSVRQMTGFLIFVRLYTDVLMVTAALAAAQPSDA